MHKQFLYFSLFLLSLSRLHAQVSLQQGTVHYRMTSSTGDTASLVLHFSPALAVLSASSAQDLVSGTFLIWDYQQEQSQGFIYADGDTSSTALNALSPDAAVEKRYKREITKEKKTIAGYVCTRFILVPKGRKKSADRITGWYTAQIKTQAGPVPNLNHEMPGFPLEISLRDSRSGGTVLFTADRISKLDTSVLGAYGSYMQRASRPKPDAARRAELAFYQDSSVRLQMPVLPGWKIAAQTYQTLTLRHDGWKAILRLQRRAPAGDVEVAPQLEKVVMESGNYLQDVLHLPLPAMTTLTFRDQPAMQRVWHYSNGRNYIFQTYSREQNPYNYFPLTELVELQRAFLIKDVVYEMQVQTVQTNYAQVLQAVEDMLKQATLPGR